VRVRRWRLGLLVLAVLAVGGLAVGGLGVSRLVPGKAGSVVAAPLAAASAASSAASVGSATAKRPQPPASAAVAVVTPGRLSGGEPVADAHADGFMEVCGYGRVAKDEVEKAMANGDGPLPPWARRLKAVLEQRADVGRSQLAARLAVGGDAERVASRLIMGDREGAAGIAAQSRDAAAYRLGLGGCGFGEPADGAPSCSGLSIQGWIERDPADARPWFSLAGLAMSRRDDAAVGEALAEAVKRPKLSSSEPLMPIAMKVAPAVVTDRKGLGMLAAELMGQQAAMNEWSAVGALSRYCGLASIKDGQRLPLCRQLAIKLLDAADNFLEAKVAQRVAERVGVSAAQQRFDAATLDAALQRYTEHTTNRQTFGLDCASIGRFADLFVERAERGELQVALDLLKHSSPPVAASAAAH